MAGRNSPGAVSATLLTVAHAPKFNTLRKLVTTTWTITALRQIRNCDVNWTQHVSGAGPCVQTYVRQDTSLHSDDGLITHQMTQKIDLKVRHLLTLSPQEVNGPLPLARTLLQLSLKAEGEDEDLLLS